MTIFLNNRMLLDAFRKGEEAALSEVYFHYVDFIDHLLRAGHFVSRVNRNILGVHDEDGRKEIVQDVFVRAFSPQARDAYDGVRPYKKYLGMIARNALIDFWRRRNRDPLARVSEDIDPEYADHRIAVEAGEENLEYQEKDSALHWQRCLDASREYVNSLDPLMQAFVRSRFIDEQPQLTVAAKLELTRWKVRSMEKKVISGLRKYLKKKKLLDDF